MVSNNWIAEAPCALPVATNDSEEPRLLDFYSVDSEEQRRAKAVCGDCPFRLMCLQKALDAVERFGIHGGADQDELRRVQSINSLGEASPPKRRIRCAYCGPRSTKNLTIFEKKRDRTHVQCTACGLKWWTRKSINAKQNNW